jgi:anion-transporting  ArsA/GET3 family ATPase
LSGFLPARLARPDLAAVTTGEGGLAGPDFAKQRHAVSLLDRRFSYVTGKGGVGKTTVAAALAVSGSRRGRRMLLAVTSTGHTKALLPNARFGASPTAVDEHLSVVHITPEAALDEYGQLLIKQDMARRALFNNRYVQGFLAAVPGLYQWAVLGKAWYHANEVVDGRPRFDGVVFDAPATGHAFEMLRVPKVVTEVAPGGALRRDADLAWQMFQDPTRSGVVLVTLPEELPTNETLELGGRIERELGLPISAVLLNKCHEPLFDADERSALESLRPALAGRALAGAEAALARGLGRAGREREQLESIERLSALGKPLVRLPYVWQDADARAGELLHELATLLAAPPPAAPLSATPAPRPGT